MKSQLLLLAFIFAVAFSSCTTAYKTGQTPDDVYFSPAQPQDEYVRTEKRDNRRYEGTDEYYDDRYLRMKVQNRYRWNDLNDWYSYDRYSYGYNYNYGTFYNPYNSWNYYYNPYCRNYSNYGYGTIKTVPARQITKPHLINLSGYTNSGYSNSNISNNPVRSAGTSSYNNTNNTNSKGLGNSVRTIFNGNSNNNSSGNSSSPSRTYTPSNNSTSSGGNNSSSGSSSGGSSGGGATRPIRN